MKLSLPLTALPLLLFAACGDRADAASGGPSVLDRASQMAKDLPGIVTAPATFDDLKSRLTSITDGPSAQRAKAGLEQIAATLQQHVDSVGGLPKWTENLGAAGDRLLRSAREQIDKLRQNPQVEPVLGPVLARLDALLGS